MELTDGGKDGAARHWDGTENGRGKGAGQKPQDKGRNHLKRLRGLATGREPKRPSP